jgi:hypothetical protein
LKKKVKKIVDGKEIEEEIDVEDEEKRNAAPSLPDGVMAARLILVSSGKMTEDAVERINTKMDADAMLEYFDLKKTNKASEPEHKGSVSGINLLPKTSNPDPRKQSNQRLNAEPEPYSAEELLDPLATADSRLNRYMDSQEVRFIRNAEGRLI